MSETAPPGQQGTANPVTLGHIVEVTRGRDASRLAVVVGFLDEHFLLLADGHKRRIDHPKRKNRAHVRPTGERDDEIAAALAAGVRVTNAKLRHCLRSYEERCVSTEDPVTKEE